MSSRQSRRSFLKRASLTAGAAYAAALLPGPRAFGANGKGQKLNCAVIGCGGRGFSAHIPAVSKENIVAIVDADDANIKKVRAWAAKKQIDADRIQTFTDYRTMFDKIAKSIDAVFIATPNHHHPLPAMIAMQLGKGVYLEKPMAHTVAECRTLAAMAAKYKVATQMGNQGHCEEGYRKLCEYIWSGAIGNVTETHSWTDRANGGIGPRPPTIAAPATLHWDQWIGPSPYRDYHVDLHPHQWHGWFDFGNGSLGNTGCHILDGVFWALKLDHPDRIEAEQIYGGGDDRYPTGTRIRWDFPARGELPAVKAYWYDGRIGDGDTGDSNIGSPKGTRGPQFLPPLVAELKKKYPTEKKFGSNGTLYVGDKGILYTGTYGEDLRFVPAAHKSEVPDPPKTLPRPAKSFADLIAAVKEGRTGTAAGFDYSSRLTEFVLLGNLAQYAGMNKPVEWDGQNMTVKNLPELNQWVKREYRSGWSA